MKRIHLTLTLLLLVVISSFAQKTNPLKESYNYKRALEAMQNEEDNSTIMQYLQKELEEHPKNGYAYMLQGVVYLDEQQVGQSLEALNKSVQLLKKDKESLKDAYRLRSKIQDERENDTEALADLARALKLDHRLGSLETGRAANIVLTDGDFNIHAVWFRGRPVGGVKD